jgi:hypothetical protein
MRGRLLASVVTVVVAVALGLCAIAVARSPGATISPRLSVSFYSTGGSPIQVKIGRAPEPGYSPVIDHLPVLRYSLEGGRLTKGQTFVMMVTVTFHRESIVSTRLDSIESPFGEAGWTTRVYSGKVRNGIRGSMTRLPAALQGRGQLDVSFEGPVQCTGIGHTWGVGVTFGTTTLGFLHHEVNDYNIEPLVVAFPKGCA